MVLVLTFELNFKFVVQLDKLLVVFVRLFCDLSHQLESLHEVFFVVFLVLQFKANKKLNFGSLNRR